MITFVSKKIKSTKPLMVIQESLSKLGLDGEVFVGKINDNLTSPMQPKKEYYPLEEVNRYIVYGNIKNRHDIRAVIKKLSEYQLLDIVSLLITEREEKTVRVFHNIEDNNTRFVDVTNPILTRREEEVLKEMYTKLDETQKPIIFLLDKNLIEPNNKFKQVSALLAIKIQFGKLGNVKKLNNNIRLYSKQPLFNYDIFGKTVEEIEKIYSGFGFEVVVL